MNSLGRIVLLVLALGTNFACAQSKVVRLHAPMVSNSQDLGKLRLVAATANIPVYEDDAGNRWLAGVDFAPFIHSWLEAQLTRWNYRPVPTSLIKPDETDTAGVLVEVRDLNINLTSGMMAYDGALIALVPRSKAVRLEFSSRIALGKLEAATIEPHVLLSYDLGPMLALIRNRMALDLNKQAAPLAEILAGK